MLLFKIWVSRAVITFFAGFQDLGINNTNPVKITCRFVQSVHFDNTFTRTVPSIKQRCQLFFFKNWVLNRQISTRWLPIHSPLGPGNTTLARFSVPEDSPKYAKARTIKRKRRSRWSFCKHLRGEISFKLFFSKNSIISAQKSFCL